MPSKHLAPNNRADLRRPLDPQIGPVHPLRGRRVIVKAFKLIHTASTVDAAAARMGIYTTNAINSLDYQPSPRRVTNAETLGVNEGYQRHPIPEQNPP